MQKQVLAINDISCVGKCSLTVALPIISSAGLCCSILPTALLSTHTGGFSNYTFLDLTDEMRKIVDHWKSLNLKFDYIYSGFLGSKRQIEVVKQIISDVKRDDTVVLIDPAMADNGILYPIFDLDFANEMKKLVSVADIICPNITEACLLSGVEYREPPYDWEYINKLIAGLAYLNIKSLVLTGVSFDEKNLGALCYNYLTKEKSVYTRERISGYYHGTGDCFASSLIASLGKGLSLQESTKKAVDFTVKSIEETIKYKNIDFKYGVCFEEALSIIGGKDE